MLKNYFLVAMRSFWRNKTFSFINILGLSIGISASIVIFLLVNYDFSFDKFEKDSARIWRVVIDNKGNNGDIAHYNDVPEPMAAEIPATLTGIELTAAFRTADESRVTIPYPDATRPVVLKKQKDLVFADENYFKLIKYDWIAGSASSSLSQPYQVVLTEKNARRYFPGMSNAAIIGKPVLFDDTIQTIVTGIVKDIPENTDFYFGTFISRPTIYLSRLKPSEFGCWSCTNSANQLFLRLAPGTSAAALGKQINNILLKRNPPGAKADNVATVLLQPFSDLHFNAERGVFDSSRQAHKPTLYGLLAVAAFLLLLACINFINLTTAQAAQRAKEIGVRKTMGGKRGQLAFQFLSETFLLTVLATLLALVLIPSLLKIFADFIPADFHFSLVRQPAVILFLLGLIVLVSLLAGLYPSFVLSGYNPIVVLKNQVYTGTAQTRSVWLRKALTVSQFVIAQVFIIATLLVVKQINYGLSKELGFKKDAILVFRTSYFGPAEKRAVLQNSLKSLPGVILVSQSSNPPYDHGTWSSTMVYNDGKKEIRRDVQIKIADSNYYKIYGFRFLGGEPTRQSDTTNSVVVNETYAHILGFPNAADAVGKQIEWNGGKRLIVGAVADFHQRSIHDPIGPLVIANGKQNTAVFSIVLPVGNMRSWPATIAVIEKSFKAVYPNDDFDYQFLDDTISKFYTTDRNVARLLGWATGLTIFISCLGLLGLVIYITNQRVKEIGIRKVIGASVGHLIFLLSRDFLKLIGLAILIAVPIAWYGCHKWLENFSFRTSLSWWIFVAGGGMLLFIAMVILCIRTFKAAAANPVDCLRSE